MTRDRLPLRRRTRDRSQALRHAFQAAFLALNAALGLRFALWVRDVSTPGTLLVSGRPAGIDGWLPIAGMMNLKSWLAGGRIPAVHPAAMFLLLAFGAIALLFRKAFCSWLCPIGTISEALAALGRNVFGRNFRVWKWLDIPLRGLKYLLLAFFLWAVAWMSAPAIDAFMHSPYGLVADVKLLDFFRFLGPVGFSVLGGLVLGSMLVRDFWCRYLCPYGALMGIVSAFSPARIRRDPDACIDCGKCRAACPARLPVDRVRSVRSIECHGCLACTAACPVADALFLSLPGRAVSSARRRRIPPAAVAAGIAAVFLGVVGFAKAAGWWESRVPRSVYENLVPRSSEVSHPMP